MPPGEPVRDGNPYAWLLEQVVAPDVPADLSFAADAGPAPIAQIRILGIEVVQSIQDLGNSVSLIAGKKTVVRVYFDHTSAAAPVQVRGELEAAVGGAAGPVRFVPTADTVSLDPAQAPALSRQRHDLKLSLNFILPAELTVAGSLWLRLGKLVDMEGASVAHGLSDSLRLDFIAGPVLRMRVIGYRYISAAGTSFAPDAIHFAYLRSFLLRALPISELRWSQIVVDTHHAPPFRNSSSGQPSTKWSAADFNAQTAAIRIQDMDGGADPGTHYLALVSDGQKLAGHALQGLATDIPMLADPAIVSVAPAGSSWGWDQDLSYADWYGTHEFCHTLGRKHIGIPTNQQGRDDIDYPYAGGLLGRPDDAFVGLDVGDADLAIPMRVLPARLHHDVMSYAADQWLSDYTYRAVLGRLTDENAAFPP